jgi:SAM-dependent methyltransferase
LEHVANPDAYLGECFRVLKSGGRLLLTTHGTFYDHACPNDFWRWTAAGLKVALQRRGFEPQRLMKITTNERAALYLLEKELDKRVRLFGWHSALYVSAIAPLKWIGARHRHLIADRCFSDRSVVEADAEDSEPLHPLYIIVASLAIKP